MTLNLLTSVNYSTWKCQQRWDVINTRFHMLGPQVDIDNKQKQSQCKWYIGDLLLNIFCLLYWFTYNCRRQVFLTAKVPSSMSQRTGHRTPRTWIRSFDLGSTAATCLLTKDSRLGSSESDNELLGTDRTGLNRQSDRPVADQNFTGYAS